MRSYAELVAANEAIRRLLESGAEASLRSIPGVVHVSVGVKERADRATDELCIRVYVREKVPEDQLPAGDRIPPSIGGVPTDVLVTRQLAFTANSANIRPVKGGTMISNGIIVAGPDGGDPTVMVGTFGCTATRTSDGKVMLLTNAHVLKANGGRINDPVYQPPQLPVPRVDASRLPLRPTHDENRIAYIADARMTDRVDAGIARLDVSSCCRCCGLDWRDEVIDLSVAGVPPANRLLGMRPAVAGTRVFKVGITTGRTVGTVLCTDVPASGGLDGTVYEFVGQIEIAGQSFVFDPFAADGDSGAIIVDEAGFVVGLLMGSATDFTPEGRHYANHIADVCSVLGITLNLDRSASDSAGRPVPKPVFQPSDEDVETYATARARVRAEPGGEWLWQLAEKHREEVVELVTAHRPVTVAWRRAGGPALFANALETLRSGGTALPVPEGVTLVDALRRIGDALKKSGSDSLRTDLDMYAPRLLAALHGSATLDDVLEKLRWQVPAPAPDVRGQVSA